MRLADTIREVMVEALERYDTAHTTGTMTDRGAAEELEQKVRSHFLDRWYRFAAFGVTTRLELAKLRIEVRWQPSDVLPDWVPPLPPGIEMDVSHTKRTTTVIVKGTPLEGVR